MTALFSFVSKYESHETFHTKKTSKTNVTQLQTTLRYRAFLFLCSWHVDKYLLTGNGTNQKCRPSQFHHFQSEVGIQESKLFAGQVEE